MLLLLAKAFFEAIVIILLSRLRVWLHNELLTKTFDLGLQLFHWLKIGAVFVFVFVDDKLLVVFVWLSVAYEAVGGHDLVVEVGLFELWHGFTEDHVMVGAARYLNGHGLLVGSDVDGY